MPFVPGWHSDFAAHAAARLTASGRYYTVAPPTKTRRAAVSLSRYRLNYYLQGAAGSCFVHSPKQMAEVIGRQLGYEVFSICRRLIGWCAKQMEDGGSAADGGSPTDAVVVMTTKGVGMAHEALDPYPVSDDENQMRQALAVRPPQAVFDDAKQSHLVAPVVVKTMDQILTAIDANKPVANGFQCPAEMQDGDTFLSTLGGNMLGGHSMLIWGYLDKGVIDDHIYLELDGWWGKIYQSLPASVAKMVDGYDPVTPTMTTSKYVRDDVYIALCNMQGGAEHVSATGLDGVLKGVVEPVPGFNPLMV